MTVTTHNKLIREKNRYIREYCKKEGWDYSFINAEQIMAIRQSKGYTQLVKEILEKTYAN